MTIKIKRFIDLPWWRWNTRELSPGKSVQIAIPGTEGLYIYTLTSQGPDTASTRTTLPYKDMDEPIENEPLTTPGFATGEEINGYGPENRPWRWEPTLEGKGRRL